MADTLPATATYAQFWIPLSSSSFAVFRAKSSRKISLHFFPPKPRRLNICKCQATEGFSDFDPRWSRTSTSRVRQVCTEAGRSKKKGGQGSSSGRLEGNAKQRRAQHMIAERRRRLKAERAQESPPRIRNPSSQSNLYAFLYGEDEVEELSQEELDMVGKGYERSVLFKEQDDPSLRHPHDWYKHGPYGPHAGKGIVVGNPVRGRGFHDRVTMFSSVKDRDEQERIDQHDAVVDYDRRLDIFDESIGVRYFWVFVRKAFRDQPVLPWDEWTLVSQVAVESGEDLDKYNMGCIVGKKARDLITQCTAWFRPDLVYVKKKPTYQVRFEPQEEFFRRLVGLLDPLTEADYMFSAPGWGRGSYYGGLCRVLGVEESASDDDVVAAFEKLGDKERSVCLDFVLSNHPIELLHPFTKGWRAREQEAISASASAYVVDSASDGENTEEEDGDEELGQGSYPKQEMFWEKQFEKTLRDFDEKEFMKMEEDLQIESKQGEMEFYPGEKKSNGSMETLGDESEDGEEEKGKSETVDSSNPFVRSAVRPFTYKNLIREISLLRHTLVEQRNHTHEPISFV